MELAYREQPLTEPVLLKVGLQGLCVHFFGILVASLTLVWFLPQFGLLSLLALSAVIVAAVFAGILKSGDVSPLRMLLAVVVPPLGTLFLYGFAAFMHYSTMASILFGLLAIAATSVLGVEPFRFFADWLLTHPRLRPESRQHTKLSLTVAIAKTYSLSLGMTTLIVILGMINNSLAIIVGILACAFLAIGFSPLDAKKFDLTNLFQYAIRLLSYFLLYGDNQSGAAGIWYPRMSSFRRHWIFVGVLVPNVLMLTAATSAFALWDFPFVRSTLVEIFKEGLKNESTTRSLMSLTPAVDWKPYLESQIEPESHEEFDIESRRWKRVTPTVAKFDLDKFARNTLDGSPYLWVVILTMGITQGKHLLIWILVLSIVFGTIFTGLFFLACFRPLLKAVYLFENDVVEKLDDDGRPVWQWYVDRMRSSTHVAQTESGRLREADHLFWGISAIADFPVLLHKRLMEEHCYIVGQTGSGKTSLGIMPLLMQMIRGTMPPPSLKSTANQPAALTAKPSEPSTSRPPSASDWTPIVILDLKGDPALFHTIKAEAEARGQEFRFFTPERGLATHVFNPFSNFSTENRTLVQLCQLILDALGLNHGEGYGRSYFTRQNREALFDALNTAPAPKTFKELSDVLKSFRGRPAYPDIFELVSTIHALTQYPQLETIEPISDPDKAIHMPTVLERRQVVYFWLPAAIESITVREIGKLALFSLLNASIDRQRSGAEQHRVYLVIDEFQRLAGENFRIILEQARSFGLSVVMANQTMADLNTPSFDLRPTVRTNARVKLHFGVTDPLEIEEISKLSGQELARVHNYSYRGVSPYGQSSRGWSEQFKNRFLISDILGVTDHPRRCILHVTRGSGYSQFGGLPTFVDCFHPLTKEQYDVRSNTPWPVFDPSKGLTTSEVDVSDIERQRNRTLVQEQEDILKSLFEKADGKFRERPQK